MPDSLLKVLTYNIHKGFSATNRHFVLHGIKDALRKVDADVVFLQEIQGEHHSHSENVDSWPDNSQFEFLADEIWPHHAYGKNAIYNNGHHGNAILSKYSFTGWENINVSTMKRASRSLLHGILELSSDSSTGLSRLHVICVHLGLFEHERARQITQLIKRIDDHVPHNEPLIIAGDFNDWRARAEHSLSSQLGVREVFKHQHGKHVRSFPAWLPMLPMDRIYSRGVEVVCGYPLQGQPWQRLSDHLPLVAEFRV